MVKKFVIVSLFIPIFIYAKVDTDALITAGIRALQNRQAEKAVILFSKVIEEKKQLFIAYYYRGVAHYSLQNAKQAIADYSAAIKLDDRKDFIYINRGAAYGAIGKLKEAIADYGTSIKINPKSPPAYMNRGLLFQRLNKLESALKDYDKAILLDPTYVKPRLYRGFIRYRLGKYQTAFDDIEYAMEIESSDYAQLYLYLLHKHTDTEKDGKKRLQSYLKLRNLPKDDWYLQIANFMIGKQSVKQLEKSADKQQEKRFSLAEAYFFIGAKYYSDKDAESAKKYLEKSVKCKIEGTIENDCAKDILKKLNEKSKKS